MKIKEAYELGRERGREAVMSINRISRDVRRLLNCKCTSREMCEHCLSFEANSREELRRIRNASEWIALKTKIARALNKDKARDAFEEGTWTGVREGVEQTLKEREDGETKPVADNKHANRGSGRYQTT